jgi:hypothetical protein
VHEKKKIKDIFKHTYATRRNICLLRFYFAFSVGGELRDPNVIVGHIRDIHSSIVIDKEATVVVALVELGNLLPWTGGARCRVDVRIRELNAPWPQQYHLF